jgi:tRNA-Thr(GGU) m(6)t(6)A37 methyltransferase TsaA
LEGAPEAWLEIKPDFVEALNGLVAGQELLVLTWLQEGRRDVLRIHPRGDIDAPIQGVFATRSPDRPNPIGLHRVKLLDIDRSGRLKVRSLEALDGTPVIDIKPILSGLDEE